jgi:hypothetical protein
MSQRCWPRGRTAPPPTEAKPGEILRQGFDRSAAGAAGVYRTPLEHPYAPSTEMRGCTVRGVTQRQRTCRRRWAHNPLPDHRQIPTGDHLGTHARSTPTAQRAERMTAQHRGRADLRARVDPRVRQQTASIPRAGAGSSDAEVEHALQPIATEPLATTRTTCDRRGLLMHCPHAPCAASRENQHSGGRRLGAGNALVVATYSSSCPRARSAPHRSSCSSPARWPVPTCRADSRSRTPGVLP